ncbi:MAG: tetratricopeptide repeat protein [Pseudomonadota bacterium]
MARVTAIVATAICLVLGAPKPTIAAELSEAQRDAMLQQMIARPSDLDLAFQYAEASAAAGDYEGAISALERVLIYAPNTPRVQFELGVLYYKIGAYEVARSYFEQVLTNPSVPYEIAEQVRLYIQQLAIAADPPPFSATIFSAIRWESNANFGPGTNTVTLNGLDFTLGSQSVGRAGWSALNIGTLHYSYDLEKQGDRLEFDFLAYSTAYFDSDLRDIDLDFFEFTFGPSFNLKRISWDQTRLFVYGIGDLAYLGYKSYFYAPGAGVRLLSFSAEQSVLDARIETRYRDFQDNSDLPTNSLRTGFQTRVGVNYSYYFAAGFVTTVQGYVQRESADVGFYSDWEMALSAGFAWTFTNPLWNAQYPLTWQLGGGFINRNYDEPDPTINRFEAEEDDTWWARTAVIVPVADTWALVPSAEYRDQNSNYDLRTFDNFTATLGIQKRF